MNIKLTVYLTAVLALAIVAVVFIINPRHKAAELLHTKNVFTIPGGSDVSGIDLHNENGDFVLKKDTQGTWSIVSPIDTRADAATVNTLLGAFESLKYGKKIGTGTLSAFGLSPASITATVMIQGNRSYGLHIGSAAPLGENYYATSSNGIPGIFTVSGWIRKQLDGTLFELRSKSLITLSQSDIASISFTKGSRPVYTLQKVKSVWTMTKPSRHAVKTSLVNDMLSRLTTIRANAILDGTHDLKSMGLEKPLEVISIVRMDNKKYSITIGKNADDNSVYAMVSGRPEVYKISKFVPLIFETPVREMYQAKDGEKHGGK